jgi:hypothetical protein
MANYEENIEFKVEFEDSDVNKAKSSLEGVDNALKRIEASKKKLEKFDLLGDVDLQKNVGVLKALKTHVDNLSSAIKAMEADTSGVDYSSKIKDLNVALKNTKSLMSDIAHSNKTLRTFKATDNTSETVDFKKAFAEFESTLTNEQRQAYQNKMRELSIQRQLNAEKQKEVQAQKRVKDANKKTYASLSERISSLEKDAEALGSDYSRMFASGDFSSLREAGSRMTSLRERARSLREEISRASTLGVDTSRLEASLTRVESTMSNIANNSSREIRRSLTSNFKIAFDKLGSLADSAFRGIFNGASTLTRNWGRLLSNTFRTTVMGWKKLLAGVFSSSGSNGGFFTNQLKSLMGYASLAGLIMIGKEAVELSSSMFEVQNVIDNVFKSASADIDAFAENTAYKFGLTVLEAKQMVGVFGGMLSASNITGEAQKEMSKNLTALTGDLASFYNMTTSDVYAKLQSGLQGNVAAMRSFGVSMTVANLEAYALSQGITTSYKEMDQATKTTLRYNYMLEQLSVAQGDFARTSGSWANQVRTLTSNFSQLLSILGGGIIKALYPALTVLNQIVSAAISAANALAKLFGFSAVDLSTMFGSGGASMPDFEGYSDGLDSVADSASGAADSAKQASENLQTFDKLNNLSTPSSGGSGGGGAGGAGGIAGALDFESYYDKIGNPEQVMNERVTAILNVLKDFAKDIASVDYSKFVRSWKNLADSLDKIVLDIGDGIIWLWKNVLFPFYKWGMEQGTPAVFDLLSEALLSLHEVIKAVAPYVDKFWQDTIAPYLSNKGEAFTLTLKNWELGLKDWRKGLEKSDDKLQYLSDTIKTIREKLYNWIDDEELTDRIDSLGDHLRGIFENLISSDTRKQAATLLRTFTKLSLIVFDNIAKVIEYLTGNTEVTEFVDFVVEEFGDLADYTFDALIEVIDYIANSEDARDIIENVSEIIKNIIDWVVENKEEILGFLNTASEVLKFASEHLWAIVNTLIVIKGIQAFSNLATGVSGIITLLTGTGGLSTALSSLSGSGVGSFGKLKSVAKGAFEEIAIAGKNMVSKVSANAGALAIPIAGIAAAEAAILAIGKHSKEYTEDILATEKEFRDAFTASTEVAENFTDKANRLFDAEYAHTYASSLGEATKAFNELDEEMRAVIESDGKLGGSGGYVSLDTARESALDYAEALRDSGYANDELIEKLESLATTDVSWGKGSGAKLKQDIITTMREISMGIQTESATIGEMTYEEFSSMFENISDEASKAGVSVPKDFSTSINKNLKFIDKASGKLYDRLSNTYSDIVDESEASGVESIVGYVEGIGSKKQFLITETGNVIDSATGVIMRMPADWRKYAKDSVSGVALTFNQDGSVKSSATNLVRGAGESAKVEATTKASETGNAFVRTISSKITEDASVVSSVATKIKEAANRGSSEAGVGGASISNKFTTSIGVELDKDTKVSSSMHRVVTSGFNTADSTAKTRSSSTGYNIVTGIEYGIDQRSWSLGEKIGSLASSVLRKFKSVLGIHSPSREFANLAKFIPSGIAMGISDNTKIATDSISELSNGLMSNFSDTDIDVSAMLNTSKFSDKYKDILYQTELFKKDLQRNYNGVSIPELHSSMVVSPAVKRAELSANIAQSSTTSRVTEGISALYNRVGVSSSGANNIVCNLVMNGEKMASFVIDTISGNAVQTGNF